MSNLRKDLADGWTHIIFCVRDNDVGERLAERIKQESIPEGQRVQVQLLSDFLG